ncbi:MAG TPA: DUF2251 domain-containing protein [Terriglobales bacterium]|nr:DUF2251 domain-containing protein [Terriglobales bacterium]
MSTKDAVRLFIEDTSGSEEYVAIFEVTDGTENDAPAGGYLYVLDRKEGKIIKHLEIYNNPTLDIQEGDVKIFWSSDGSKCGLAIWGRMHGVIDIVRRQGITALLEGHESLPITDPEGLKGFEDYLDQKQFIQARQRYWKEMVKQHEPNAQPGGEDETPIETNFIVYSKGPNGWFAVFEDDGETGYLYLYNSEHQKVARHLHIYDCSEKLNVAAKDVKVMWSKDGTKCGVMIWNKMRGIINLKGAEGRVWMENRDTPGIGDQEWLSGFDSAASGW